MASIVKVMSRDPIVNRIQDNVRDTVNPLVARVDAMTPSVVTSAPTASVDLVGRMVIVQAVGSAATIRVCVPNSAGKYEWVTVGTST